MSRYKVNAYDSLNNPRARMLYDWLVRYHRDHSGRRASHTEMMAGQGLSKEPLLELLAALTAAGLFEIEEGSERKARSYTLPGERWTHPHLVTMESRQTFYTESLLDKLP